MNSCFSLNDPSGALVFGGLIYRKNKSIILMILGTKASIWNRRGKKEVSRIVKRAWIIGCEGREIMSSFLHFCTCDDYSSCFSPDLWRWWLGLLSETCCMRNWRLDNWYLPITINSVLGRDVQFCVTNLCRVSALIESEHVLCCKIIQHLSECTAAISW